MLVPVIVRPDGHGEYEMISGHRRRYASILAGKKEIPAIVREMDDDTATILMVDSNLQREHILPSERAKAYKMKMEKKGEDTMITMKIIGSVFHLVVQLVLLPAQIALTMLICMMNFAGGCI